MSEFGKYASAVDKCAEMAKSELSRLIAKLDTSHKIASRDALLAAVPRIVERYGSLAATAAAEYYEKNRMQQIGGTYRAKLGSPEQLDAIESSVRYACGHLFTKEADDGR